MIPTLSQSLSNKIYSRSLSPESSKSPPKSVTDKPIATKQELQDIVDANLVALVANTLEGILKRQNQEWDRFLENIAQTWAEIEKWDAIRKSS
jgi:hypothetical protein